MTKSLTLWLLFIGNIVLTFSKNSLQIHEINPATLNSSAAKLNTNAFRFEGKDYLVVQPNINSEADLKANGLEVQSYLGDGYYLVASDAQRTDVAFQNLSYSKAGYIPAEQKIESSLLEQTGVQPVTVMYASSIGGNALTDLIAKTGIQLINNNATFHHFSAHVNAAQLQQLATYPFVYFITKYYAQRNYLMYDALLMTGTNQVQEAQPYGYNLKGEDINVGVWDAGAVGTSIDLPISRNYVVDKEYSAAVYMSHPTEVAGCIGGAGNIFGPLRGMAPRCNMYYWDVLGDIVKEILDGKTNYGVDISNHSYSFLASNCFQSGMYIPEAADLDKTVYEHPTLLPVVAVGNTASTNCAVATDTFSSVDIGFQGCKNALTVGWLFADERIVENSGRGPTMDGRIKPELVSKGFAVTALTPNSGITLVYGSSYAAPQIAGIAALLNQQYKKLHGSIPNASLVRAVLLNTARDLGNPGPDYIYGFGKPDALRAVKSITDNLFIEDELVQAAMNTRSIVVPENTAQLKVTLSWTDKEGSPLASKAIVNNLDLKLVTPSGDTILPWRLKPENPTSLALRGVDNINTNEQVTIDNPVAGNYKIVVKGTSVPYGPQGYAVAYYTQDRKIELTHPNGGEVLGTGTSYIKWNANGIDSLAKIEFSSDSGATWQAVADNVRPSSKTYTWSVPSVVSKNCLVKITAGSNVAVSASTFSIGMQVFYQSITNTVCDRSVQINWSAVAGATAYRIYLFADSAWTLAGESTQASYTICNLINGKNYLYSISVVSNGVEGNHSLTKSFIPTPSGCSTANDIGIYAVNKPLGGRKFTSSALSSTEKLSFVVKNYGTVTQNTLSVSYRINGGSVKTTTLADVLTPNDTALVNFNISEDLSAAGVYNVLAWTNLTGDNNFKNDTLRTFIKQLPNLPVTLPQNESFEGLYTQLTTPTFGLNGLDYIDYYPEDGGRLRSDEGNLYARTGKRAITLDNYYGTGIKKNEVILTYNLSNYVDSLVFLNFHYMNRSEPDSNDFIFARGDDTKPWVRIYDLFTNRGSAGAYKEVSGLNLYQKLKIENNQNFSSSTQLKIVQTGSKVAYTPYADGGYSFDDFELFVAGRDVAARNLSIKKVHCSKTFTEQPIRVTLLNNSSQAITGLPIFCQIGNGNVISEIISSTIQPADSLVYTFNATFNNAVPGFYPIKVWVNNPGDKYTANDTVSASVIVMKTIDSFPYYNDLETDNGGLFAEGTNNSWVWGTPLKYNINDAAQGNKAWTTGIDKGYNFNEDSYLYMGCMDFSALSVDPQIAFNFISDIQTRSDSAYAEYSTDGINWIRLGCYGCGLNWYNGYQSKPYWDRQIYPWQVAHTKVSLNDLIDPENFMYRLHLQTDDYIVSEGIGIDDIRVFNEYQDIATADSVYVSQESTGDGWIQFLRNGRLVAELYDAGQNLGNISLGYEANTDKHKMLYNKNIFPRNWVFKPQRPIPGNYKVRLYVLNNEYTNYVLNEDSINRMGDISMIRYIGLNTNLDISDNHVRAYYKYYTPQQIQFYPYQNGYYVEFETDTLGEFYLVSTRQDADAIQNISLIDFSAERLNDDVYLQWQTSREINSKEFVIQYSFDAITFIDVDTVPAGGFSNNTTLYNYLHQLNATSGVYYYRIKMVDNTNRFTYSLIDSVYFAPSVGIKQNTAYAKAYISTNDIVISFSNKLQMPVVINVYNALGQLQYTRKTILQNGDNPLGITDFTHWSNGAYFLQIQGDEHSYYSKLIKQ